MAFESWKQYQEFSEFIRRSSRHVLDVKSKSFVQAVLDTSAKRRESIDEGALLWRAQLGHEWRTEVIKGDDGQVVDSFDVESPFPPERMTPLPDRAFEGRVNPKGIPCLYFSTDMRTAMAETRPWIGSQVSVAQFVILRRLSLVDCSSETARDPLKFELIENGVDGQSKWRFKPPDMADWENIAWGDINRAFSAPVTRTDDVADYAPTQVLAESFRSAGFDGVVYGSKVGSGKTVAVFDLGAAALATCELHQVESVQLQYRTTSNRYFIRKYCETATLENDKNANEN